MLHTKRDSESLMSKQGSSTFKLYLATLFYIHHYLNSQLHVQMHILQIVLHIIHTLDCRLPDVRTLYLVCVLSTALYILSCRLWMLNSYLLTKIQTEKAVQIQNKYCDIASTNMISESNPLLEP